MVSPKLNRLKVTILGLLLTLAFFTLDVKAALAHYPHDDIFAVEVSPNYQQDQTLFINVRGNLFKSKDGGDSWQTIVNGLDHQHELSALDISAQSQKILFLATLGDGIYKSENEGDSWSQVNQGLETLSIDLVAIAPDSPDVVFAAGTESGLYKTENGGTSWSPVMTEEEKITAVAFDSAQQDKITIGDNQGNLFFSGDRGQTWQRLATLENSGGIKTVAISPNFAGDRTFWVGTEQGGIFKTVDGGVSFAQANNGISDRAIMSLAISPNYQKDGTILASTWHEGVFRSNDGGKSWKKSSKGLTEDGQADLPNFNRPHFSDLRISQTYNQDRTVFVAGFDGLFKSTDGGRVWREVNTLSSNIIVGLGLSPDYQNDSTVAFTTYLGGAYISHDQGVTWTTINKGLERDNFLKRIPKRILQDNFIARLFDIVFSPNYREDKTIFSPSWTHFLKSTDRGQHWQKIPLFNEPSSLNRPTKYSIAISPNFASDGSIYLGSMQGTGKGSILKSTDGGLNFSVVGNVNSQPVVYLAISPNFAADKTLYAGVKDGVYKTVDGGKTWQPAGNGIPSMQQESKLAISPNYKIDQTVFAGTTAGLFVTRDGGESWDKLTGTTASEDGYVEAVAISPNYQSDQTLIMNVRGRGLFKTVDGGTTFTQVGNDLLNSNHSLANMYGFWPPTMAIKFSPSYSLDRTIYGVSETKLFKSTDGGNTWANVSIPTPQQTSLIKLMTYYYFRLSVSPIYRFLTAAIAALSSYLVLGRLRLEKKMPLKRMQIKAGTAFAAFVVVLILLSV
ncbi:MAG: YCF48-related protein [Pleurocapsa sp. MO_192.B19]|nr:YCF48-related protein [Pleurocapsa sp. MO_192.B19]